MPSRSTGTARPAPRRRFGVARFAARWRHPHVLAADLTDDRRVIATLLDAGRLEVDDDGTRVAVDGLAARPTAHRNDHAVGGIHMGCALDAIGIPAALGIDGTAITICPACGTELRVQLDGGTPVDAASLVLWLPDSAWDHLVEDFCNHATLYCNDDHLATAVPPAAAGRSVTVSEVADIGRQIWADASKVLHR